MQAETLKLISDDMELVSIPYEYEHFNSDISSLNQYWVGIYQENEPMNESGEEECEFILTGTAKGSMLELEQSKQKIKELYPPVGGKMATLDNGSNVAIFYSSAFSVPTEDAELKKLQINLKVKEWTK